MPPACVRVETKVQILVGERVSKGAVGVVICGWVITLITVVTVVAVVRRERERERECAGVHSPRSKSCREVGVVHDRLPFYSFIRCQS